MILANQLGIDPPFLFRQISTLNIFWHALPRRAFVFQEQNSYFFSSFSMETGHKQCQYCRETIKKDATKCPKCQADLRSWSKRHPIISFLLFLFFFTAFVQAFTENYIKPVEQVVNPKMVEARKNILIKGYVEEDMFPNAVLEVTNNTKHTIDLLAFSADVFNNAGEKQREQISRDDFFSGQSQELILPWKKVVLRWQLSLFPHATKIGNIKIIKLHYRDSGETIDYFAE